MNFISGTFALFNTEIFLNIFEALICFLAIFISFLSSKESFISTTSISEPGRYNSVANDPNAFN